MIGTYKGWVRVLIFTVMAALTAPLILQGAGDTGRDWQCSEAEVHTGDYKKHLKLHIDRGANIIADKLEKVYNNQSLTSEETQAKTIEILNKYLSQTKAGMGD